MLLRIFFQLFLHKHLYREHFYAFITPTIYFFPHSSMCNVCVVYSDNTSWQYITQIYSVAWNFWYFQHTIIMQPWSSIGRRSKTHKSICESIIGERSKMRRPTNKMDTTRRDWNVKVGRDRKTHKREQNKSIRSSLLHHRKRWISFSLYVKQWSIIALLVCVSKTYLKNPFAHHNTVDHGQTFLVFGWPLEGQRLEMCWLWKCCGCPRRNITIIKLDVLALVSTTVYYVDLMPWIIVWLKTIHID